MRRAVTCGGICYTPVLVDDIISTARTMIESVRRLRHPGLAGPVCLAVHPVFSPGAYDELLEAGAREVVTCNTIPDVSHRIDVVSLLVTGLTDQLATIAPQ